MVPVRPHHDAHWPGEPGGGGDPLSPANRLNLLLSCASWRPESWADRLPRLLEPMGVAAVRAATARQAERVIRGVTIHIAIVDLGLPLDDALVAGPPAEEGGTRILELLARLTPVPPVVVIQSAHSQRDSTRSMAAALRSGAFAVVDRSAADIEIMLEVMRRCLGKFYSGRWPAA